MIKYLDNLYIPSGPINYMDDQLKRLAHEGDEQSQMKWFLSEWNEYIHELTRCPNLRVVMNEALDVAGCIYHFPDIRDRVKKYFMKVNPLYLEALMMHIKRADSIITHDFERLMEKDCTHWELWTRKQTEKGREVTPLSSLQDMTIEILADALSFHFEHTSQDKDEVLRQLQMRVHKLAQHFK